jgi:hypothetical protein
MSEEFSVTQLCQIGARQGGAAGGVYRQYEAVRISHHVYARMSRFIGDFLGFAYLHICSSILSLHNV